MSPFDGDDDLVFPTSTGQHYDNPANIRQRVLKPAIVSASAVLTLDKRPPIPTGVTPHSLRHTYCSLLIAQGEELPTVAAQMRHADLSTTLRIYTHVMKHRREGVAERLDTALWGTRIPVAIRSHKRRSWRKDTQAAGRTPTARTPTPLYKVEPKKRARQDSNLRLLPPEGSALSTELRAPGDRV